MAVDEQAPCFGRVAAKSQNGLDVPSLRQQNVRVRLDRIMKAKGRAKVRVVRLERVGSGHSGSRIDRIWVTPRPWWPMSSSSPQIAKAGKDEGFMGVPLA